MIDLLLVSAGLTGLYAGLHLGFSIAVMPGLARSGDETFVEGMRGINRAIRNPVFGALFLGAPIVSAITALERPGDGLRWIALLLVVTATVITLAVNAPLNTRLDTTEDAASVARGTFERPWIRAHTLRTGALVLSTAAALGAVVV